MESKVHLVNIENRLKTKITGVQRVIDFNENEIRLETSKGFVFVKGKNLEIKHLNVQEGEVEILGQVDSLVYGDSENGPRGVWQRIWK